jgi:hypothetical protein
LKYTDPTGLSLIDDFFAGVGIVVGFLISPFNPGLGSSLIQAGFTHFGEAASNVINLGMSWNNASDAAGFSVNLSFSFTPQWATGKQQNINYNLYNEYDHSKRYSNDYKDAAQLASATVGDPKLIAGTFVSFSEWYAKATYSPFKNPGIAQSATTGLTFPSFSTLWNNYPQDVKGSHAHPSVDPYPNQCAIRVSDAFQKSGIDMSSYPKVNKTSDGYARSSKNLADWTWQNFGKPKIMSQDAFEKNYSNSKGLMYIAPPPGGVGHIDLFNAGSTGSGYYLGSEIWFWPIK